MSNDKSIADKVADGAKTGGRVAGDAVGGPLGEVLEGAGGFVGKAMDWAKGAHNWLNTHAPNAYKFGILLIGGPMIMKLGQNIIKGLGNALGIKSLMNFGDEGGVKGFLKKALLIGGAVFGANALAKKATGETVKVKDPGMSEAAKMRMKALEKNAAPKEEPTNDAEKDADQAKDVGAKDIDRNEGVEADGAADADEKPEVKTETVVPAEISADKQSTEAVEKTSRTSAFRMETDGVPDVKRHFSAAGTVMADGTIVPAETMTPDSTVENTAEGADVTTEAVSPKEVVPALSTTGPGGM